MRAGNLRLVILGVPSEHDLPPPLDSVPARYVQEPDGEERDEKEKKKEERKQDEEEEEEEKVGAIEKGTAEAFA